MQFNPATTYNSLVESINDLANTNNEDYTLIRKARAVNNGIDHITALVIESLDAKGWDDANHIELPNGTFDITSGARNVVLNKDESGNTILKVLKVLLKTNSTWSVLRQREDDNYRGSSFYNDTPTGIPGSYSWNGSVLTFDTVPNYTLADGGKIFFIRTADYVTEADTTQEIGFTPIFHKYFALYAAYEWAMAKGLANKNDLMNEMIRMEGKILGFYAKQSKENPTRIGWYNENYE
jgi:hypothetical protein